ncbi:MAG TPA: CpsD/CapB family tyrosine-protein kinase, partial [Acidimicrobiia bacterium]
GNNTGIPTAVIASTLTTLAGEVPTTLAPSITAIVEPVNDDVTITRITEVEGNAESPLNEVTVRITGRGSTPEEAAAITESAATALGERVAATTEPEPWPLQLVPTALVPTGEIIETTTDPSQPVDRTTTNIILGLLIGLALGVGYAFLMSSRDKTIYGPRQLVEATGEPAFGVIPTSKVTTGWAALSEHDLGGEGYRALRSNVLLGLKDTTVLALVSPTTGTGTHTIGINLAISLAQSGSSVCVVETALSQPRLADLLELNSAPGLAEAITSTADLDASIQRVDALGFDVITAGATTNDVTDTLTSRALHTTIDQLRERYDRVLLLCAPAVESPEASAVTPLSDATLIIIRVASTSMTDLEITARVLLQVNTKIAGIIANDVPHEHTDQWRRYLPMSNPQQDQVPN